MCLASLNSVLLSCGCELLSFGLRTPCLAVKELEKILSLLGTRWVDRRPTPFALCRSWRGLAILILFAVAECWSLPST